MAAAGPATGAPLPTPAQAFTQALSDTAAGPPVQAASAATPPPLPRTRTTGASSGRVAGRARCLTQCSCGPCRSRYQRRPHRGRSGDGWSSNAIDAVGCASHAAAGRTVAAGERRGSGDADRATRVPERSRRRSPGTDPGLDSSPRA